MDMVVSIVLFMALLRSVVQPNQSDNSLEISALSGSDFESRVTNMPNSKFRNAPVKKQIFLLKEIIEPPSQFINQAESTNKKEQETNLDAKTRSVKPKKTQPKSAPKSNDSNNRSHAIFKTITTIAKEPPASTSKTKEPKMDRIPESILKTSQENPKEPFSEKDVASLITNMLAIKEVFFSLATKIDENIKILKKIQSNSKEKGQDNVQNVMKYHVIEVTERKK